MYLQLCTLEQKQNIYSEFNITEESLQNDVTHLMGWIEEHPYLPKIKDEVWLSNFLIRSKNHLEKAKFKLEEYYKARALVNAVVTNRDPTSTEMRNILKYVNYVALPKLTPEGDRILVWKIFDPEKAQLLTADQFVKIIYFTTDLLLKADDARKIIQIFDLEYMSVSFAMMMVVAVKKISLVLKPILVAPRRAESVIVLHVNSVLEPLLNTMKAFLTKKLQNRVIFRRSDADLTNILPKELLPCDYGGDGKSMNAYRDDYAAFAEGFKNWFNEEDSMKADISKIPGFNHETFHQLFGTDESFKNLAFD